MNKKIKCVLQEEFLQHQIEVTFILSPTDDYPEFIPDCVKIEILNQLADDTQGEFVAEQTFGHNGKWRILELKHPLMHRLAAWNLHQEKPLTEKEFIKAFGKYDGINLYERWVNYYKCDAMAMMTHFGPSGVKGQKFCNMLVKHINKGV